MGVVLHRKVINNYVITPELFSGFLGNGMEIKRHHGPAHIEIALGNGLRFDEHGRITLRLGKGLGFDEEGNVIAHCEGDNIEIDEEKTQCFTIMTDSSLSLDGRRLILTKTYRDVIVKRNRRGYVVCIEQSDPYCDSEDVIFTDYCYCPPGYSSRTGTEDQPNFYEKAANQ